jgi:membrane fusion protein, adhesin transport system
LPSPFSHTTRALAHDGATRALWAWGLAAAVLAAWAAWFLLGSVTVVEVSRKARLEVRQAAHAVNAPLAGTLVAAVPALGTEVAAGDVLVELDAGALALRLREEQAHRDGLLAQMAALRQEVAAREKAAGLDRRTALAAEQGALFRTDEAGAAAAFADDNERRLAAESEAGGVARVDALQARAEARKLAAAKDALAAEARRIGADALTREAQQRAQVNSLQRTLATLQADAATSAATQQRLALEIEHHRIRAPVAGRVGEVAPLHAGEFVAAGQKLVTLIPAGELIAVADFEPAAVLGRVRPGQSAQLRLDGFPWAQYGTVAATVSRVAGEIRDNHIRVEFTPRAGWPAGVQAQHGLPGTMEVTLETVAPARLLLRATGQRLSGAAGS